MSLMTPRAPEAPEPGRILLPGICGMCLVYPEAELMATWDQKNMKGEQIAAGEYTARGMLLVEGEPLATQAVKFLVAA